mmetsp:Transcript_5020/g.14220  ORF Transcript_5020/g.14220 Transcript_5020/m.14220 type:complete len:207 (-) Transcript_5020:82-702(-)
MPGEHLLAGHVSWQQTVDKERKFAEKHMRKTLKQAGMPRMPLVPEDSQPGLSPGVRRDLHKSASFSALDGAAGAGRRSCSTPFLPKIADRSATPFVFSREEQRDVAGEGAGLPPPSRRSVRTSSSRHSASCGHLPFAGDAIPGTPSCRGSMRSSITGLTTASLRREVQEAVQMEVAKVVQPLQERLQTEKSTRQRLEEMLRHAKGG